MADRIILILIACLMTMGVIQSQMTYMRVVDSQHKIEENQQLILDHQQLMQDNQNDLIVNQRAILTQLGTLNEACRNE